MALTRKTHSAEIEADLEDCIAVITDFESHPRWSTPVLWASILACDEKGRGRIIAFELDAKIRALPRCSPTCRPAVGATSCCSRTIWEIASTRLW